MTFRGGLPREPPGSWAGTGPPLELGLRQVGHGLEPVPDLAVDLDDDGGHLVAGQGRIVRGQAESMSRPGGPSAPELLGQVRANGERSRMMDSRAWRRAAPGVRGPQGVPFLPVRL